MGLKKPIPKSNARAYAAVWLLSTTMACAVGYGP